MQIKLIQLRKEAGLTQADLAKIINKSEATYRSKELDDVEFKVSEMYRIANYFEKELGEIFIEPTSRKVNKVNKEG